MSSVAVAVLGSAVAVAGALLMWFRVPVAAFFREQRLKKGSRSANSQTPALAFAVGALWFLVGSYLAVGTLAGWIQPH